MQVPSSILATRSGTNEYHGEALEFLQEQRAGCTQLLNTVAVPQSPFKRNDFGADFGGPMVKNRHSSSCVRRDPAASIHYVEHTVPSANARAGVTAPAIQKLLA